MYALPMTCPEIRHRFYANLDTELRDTLATDMLVILGDLNTRVGREMEHWRGVVGRHWVRKMNSNGLLLLSKCAKHNLLIINIIFRLADKYKTAWMHPRSKHWHLIDYIIITRLRDNSYDLITRAMRGAECWTDHRPIRAKISIRIVPQHHKRPKLIIQAFNTARLQIPAKKVKSKFQEHGQEK